MSTFDFFYFNSPHFLSLSCFNSLLPFFRYIFFSCIFAKLLHVIITSVAFIRASFVSV